MLIQSLIRVLEHTKHDVEMLSLTQLTPIEQLYTGEEVEGYFRLNGEVLNCRDFDKVGLDHPLTLLGADLVFEYNGCSYAMWADWGFSTLVQYTIIAFATEG